MTDEHNPEAVKELREFLGGSGPLDGHWFGDEVKPRFWWRKHLPRIDTLAAKLAGAEAEAKRAWSEADSWAAKYHWSVKDCEAAEAELSRLRQALVDHNELLRSALQIAKREGVNGEVGTTNWDAYYNRVAVLLKRHHQTVNDARATLTTPTTPTTQPNGEL